MRCFLCGLIAVGLLWTHQAGLGQSPFNGQRGVNPLAPTYSQIIKQRSLAPQYGGLYSIKPIVDYPINCCCGPVFLQPYWVPPLYTQSFGVTVIDPLAPSLPLDPNLPRPGQPPVRQALPGAAVPVKVSPAPKQRDELEQKAEMQRLLRKGNEGFAQGEYKQALGLYQQAVAVAPLEPTAYFHLAQAHLALGKLAEAGVAIERGMRLHANWPNAPFQPRALYRDVAGDYQRHLGILADEVGKNLNDEALLFLLGYQLWFDGKRDEAVTLFQRAGALAHDTTLIDRFLRAAKPVDGE